MPETFTNYSRKDLIKKQGGKIYGNWSSAFAGACINTIIGAIEEGSVEEMKDVGNCSEGGYTIVRAVHH